MSNIVDYVKWRGDLSLKASPMNEIDNLIMARISYLPFEKVEFFDVIEFEKLVEEFLKLAPEKFHEPEDIDLIQEMVKSERFKELKISNVKAKFSQEEEIQFFAVTVLLPNGELFVSFRGTDATLVGWKEDFNMSFMSNLPSQKEGVDYLETISKKYPLKKIRVGRTFKRWKCSSIFWNILSSGIHGQRWRSSAGIRLIRSCVTASACIVTALSV